MESINLDRFTRPPNAFGTMRATEYTRAWPGAAGEIEVSICYQRDNDIVQFGRALDAPGAVLWRRQKPINGIVWSDWMEDMGQGGVSDGNNAKVSRCKMADGSVTIYLPSWHKMNIVQCDGVLMMHDMVGGGCDIMSTGVTEYETTAYVSQSYDQWVCYGVSRDGGPVMEVGRQQVKSGEQFVYYRAQFYSVEGTHLDYYISSTFQWQATVWRDVQMSAVQG